MRSALSPLIFFALLASSCSEVCESYSDCAEEEVCLPPAGESSDAPRVCQASTACLARSQACEKDTFTCGELGTYNVCDFRGSDGCYSLAAEFSVCSGDAACFGPAGAAYCRPVCDANSDCSAPEVCQMTAGRATLFCGPASAGPTADSMCTVTIESADFSAQDGGVDWDFGSGPDPLVSIMFGSGTVWQTTVIEDMQNAVWNETSPSVTYAEIAYMAVSVADEDDGGGIFGNDDDLAAEFRSKDGTWYMDGQNSRQFELTATKVTLRLSIACQ